MSLPVISRSSADLVCRRLQRAFIAYCCLTFWGALPPGSMAAGEAESIALFNGRNLEGWVQRGGKAQYSVEGDTIVGTSVLDTPNSFLCTDREYADFILELELKVDEGLNSGIQIRSHCFDQQVTAAFQDGQGKGVTKQIPAGCVHGYQVEIDPTDRAYSGGIYDEGRRGWLNDLKGEENRAAREAFQRAGWNKYRIEAIGNSIKTWVNGVPAANLTDDMDAAGFIGLQVHGVGNAQEMVGKQVRWRKILIRDLACAE
ncbi:MAG: DUF1080 domain-containing protein [Pirellulales bacterium]|nr:DUF1080 domain-containing protein [Pirellulales bacterium]